MQKGIKDMNMWQFYGLMVFLNASIVLHGMELTNHEKTLSPNVRIIRRYFFSEEHLVRYLDEDCPIATLVPKDIDDFLESGFHVVRTSPNIANSYDQFHGISCVIRPGKDVITADAKYITIGGKDSYKIPKKDKSSPCSLAYTPKYIAVGFADGSFAVRSLHKNSCMLGSSCYEGPVTSICMPSPHICVLGGGNAARIHNVRDIQKYSGEGKHTTSLCGKVMTLGTDKKGNPYCADILAVAGPFIVMQTKKNKSFIKSPYSLEAFCAIQNGTFAEPQENLLGQIIKAQKNEEPKVLSEKDQEVFSSLCPTIQNVISHGWKNN